MAVSEVAVLNTDIVNGAGVIQLPIGTSGVVTGVFSIDERLMHFVVASTEWVIKQEDLDFVNGDIGILRAYFKDKEVEIVNIDRPEPNYDGIVRITFADGTRWTIESDRVSGNLQHTVD